MKRNYILTEVDTEHTFAVISDIDETDLNPENKTFMDKVIQAVTDEFGYEDYNNDVEYFENSFHVTKGFDAVVLTVKITDDEGEDEVRDLELSMIAIY